VSVWCVRSVDAVGLVASWPPGVKPKPKASLLRVE
jgi:hypothetical protein